MKRSLLLCCAISLFLVAPAYAGINLSWDDCGTAGIGKQEFACDTNTGAPFTLVGSLILNPWEQAYDAIVGVSATIAVMGTQEQLPDWWKFGSSGCRGSSALTASFDFQDPGPYTCADPWVTQMQGMVSYEITSATDARIRVAGGLPVGETVALDGDTEYYMFKVRIARSRSTGTGACAGCSMPSCLLLDRITLHRSAELNYDIIDTAAIDNIAYWHGAYIYIWDDFENHRSGIGCAPDQPTRASRSTWGALKSLYR